MSWAIREEKGRRYGVCRFEFTRHDGLGLPFGCEAVSLAINWDKRLWVI